MSNKTIRAFIEAEGIPYIWTDNYKDEQTEYYKEYHEIMSRHPELLSNSCSPILYQGGVSYVCNR